MKKIMFLVFVLIIPFALKAQNALDKFKNNTLLQNANISLLIKDLNSNKTVYGLNENNSMIPASTMKLLTTASALEILGPDFYYKTTLEIEGKITENGVLNGNLIIRGAGDPTLGSDKIGDKLFLQKWVAAIKNAGIKSIKGDIIVDTSLFDSEAVNPKWTWEDIGNYYASGCYGISYLDNTYQIILNSGAVGTKPSIEKTIPEIAQLVFENNLESSKITYDSAYIYGAPRSYLRTIQGAIPSNRKHFIIKGDIPEPDILLAEDLKNELQKNAVNVSGNLKNININPSDTKKIYTHSSPPLKEIIREINVRSNNHFAEHLFRTLALQNYEEAAVSKALWVVQNFWKSKGLPIEELFMCDGSGLSPTNAVSANFLTELLIYMKNKSKYSDDFYKSLPLAGKEGTLSSFLKNTDLEGRVRAKSGSISRVRSYAGYIDNEGRQYVFTIIVNNPNGNALAVRKKIEEFLLNIK